MNPTDLSLNSLVSCIYKKERGVADKPFFISDFPDPNFDKIDFYMANSSRLHLNECHKIMGTVNCALKF